MGITPMGEIERLIARFRNEDTGSLADPDNSIKPNINESLEDQAADPRALNFLLHVAADRHEFDLARIEALKVFELRKARDDEERIRISLVLRDVLVDDPDDDVRQYAAMAAASYMSDGRLAEAVVARAFDEGEDINLRWNAFTAIKQLGPTPQGIELLRRASETPEFRTSAAAATGVEVKSAKAIEGPAVFRADHPFVFLIRDDRTGSILFLGRLVNPRG